MPRKPRENAAGTFHHIYARGVDGLTIFRDDVDRHLYLRLLQEVTASYEWKRLAYCLMTNHVHLLVRTEEPTLADGMRSLHGRYAQKFNFRHERKGHLFQQRYGSTRITSDAHFHAAARYIALNPVEAGLCAAPGDWRWSDYPAGLVVAKADPTLDLPRRGLTPGLTPRFTI